MKLLDKILKAGEGKRLKAVQALVAPINALEPETQKLSDAELQGRTAVFKERLDNGATLDDILSEAFATVREAAWRVIGQRHYDVQLMGGAALHWGSVAEMRNAVYSILTQEQIGILEDRWQERREAWRERMEQDSQPQPASEAAD